jgi:hypothetical protein
LTQRYMLARHMIKKPEDFKATMQDFSDEFWVMRIFLFVIMYILNMSRTIFDI